MKTKLQAANAIINKVEQMRKEQVKFFKSRNNKALAEAKRLEREIDQDIKDYKNWGVQTLF